MTETAMNNPVAATNVAGSNGLVSKSIADRRCAVAIMTPNPTTAPAVRRDTWAQFRDDVERTVIASGIFTKKQRQPKIDLILDSAHNHASHGATVEVGCKRREMDIHGHHAQHQVRRGADPAQVDHVDVEH